MGGELSLPSKGKPATY